MRAFVIRPFKPDQTVDYDPSRVQRELITPALAATGYTPPAWPELVHRMHAFG